VPGRRKRKGADPVQQRYFWPPAGGSRVKQGYTITFARENQPAKYLIRLDQAKFVWVYTCRRGTLRIAVPAASLEDE
jgi:hypothetical protein